MRLSKVLLFALIGIFFSATPAHSYKGMWLPFLLEKHNAAIMTNLGLSIPISDIYSNEDGSLKDAVFIFGGGCTSELVSSQGLLFTNHHCGYYFIQQHSSVEKNYLKDGFYAPTLKDELPCQGLTATRIVRMEDVTPLIIAGVTPGAPNAGSVIQANIAKVIEDVTRNTHFTAEVKPIYYGNQYLLIVKETFNDVRMVLAPPSYIGKFGYDADNWMWPRHTGDFAVFRVYAGENNKPAEYASTNRPYQPIRYLKTSMAGVKENDFTFVYGFPGRTEQYLPSDAVKLLMEKLNPARIGMRDRVLQVMNAAMLSNEAVNIQYASKQSRIANYWKKWIGENRGLRKLNAVQAKVRFESKVVHKGGSSKTLKALQELYASASDLLLARELYQEYIGVGPELIRLSYQFLQIAEQKEKLESEGRLKPALDKLKASIPGFFKNFRAEVDQQIFVKTTPFFLESLPKAFKPELLNLQVQKSGINRFAASLYQQTMFTDPTSLETALTKFDGHAIKRILQDPMVKISKELYGIYFGRISEALNPVEVQKEGLLKAYVADLLAIFGPSEIFPDANSTLRVTYGKVEPYHPADGIYYHWQTFTRGILQKYIPNDPDFHISDAFRSLLMKKEFAPYYNGNSLPVAFIASNHTTGGNSGSPVLNGKGELIGINFDRSWESTMSDIMYDPNRCRNITVDIRFVCYVIDKHMGGKRLIEEMELLYP
jgi:hypothetical protein